MPATFHWYFPVPCDNQAVADWRFNESSDYACSVKFAHGKGIPAFTAQAPKAMTDDFRRNSLVCQVGNWATKRAGRGYIVFQAGFFNRLGCWAFTPRKLVGRLKSLLDGSRRLRPWNCGRTAAFGLTATCSWTLLLGAANPNFSRSKTMNSR